MELEVPPEKLLAHFEGPHGSPLPSVRESVLTALASPFNFPPLSQATVPGDLVTLAIDPEVPRLVEVVSAVVEYLVGNGTEPSNITLLCSKQTEPKRLLKETLAEDIRQEVQQVFHEPTDKNQIGLLGHASDDRSIYLNRALLDADLVIPICCLRPTASPGYWGIHTGIYPTFSDYPTIKRFLAPSAATSAVQSRLRCKESEEASWRLGVLFSIQILPDADDCVVEVWAGSSTDVSASAMNRCNGLWRLPLQDRPDLVVVALGGAEENHNWQFLGRALLMAQTMVTDGGAIAVRTQIADEPPETIARLGRDANHEASLHRLYEDHSCDAVTASFLVRAMQQARVYLLSQVDETVIEDLGITPLSEPKQIQRLIKRCTSAVLLYGGKYIQPAMDDMHNNRQDMEDALDYERF